MEETETTTNETELTVEDAGQTGESASPTVRKARFAPLEAGGEAAGGGTIDLLMDVQLELSVELGRARMSVRDVLQLGQGSIVELEKLAGEPVDVLVNGTLVARGEVIVVDENFGVRVTELVQPGQPMAA